MKFPSVPVQLNTHTANTRLVLHRCFEPLHQGVTQPQFQIQQYIYIYSWMNILTNSMQA